MDSTGESIVNSKNKKRKRDAHTHIHTHTEGESERHRNVRMIVTKPQEPKRPREEKNSNWKHQFIHFPPFSKLTHTLAAPRPNDSTASRGTSSSSSSSPLSVAAAEVAAALVFVSLSWSDMRNRGAVVCAFVETVDVVARGCNVNASIEATTTTRRATKTGHDLMVNEKRGGSCCVITTIRCWIGTVKKVNLCVGLCRQTN